MTVKTFNAHDDIELIKQTLHEMGAVIIENMTDANDLYNELHPYFSNVENCQGEFYGNKTKRFSGLINKSPICRNLAINPVILDIVNFAIGRYCDCIQLNLTQAIEILPGQSAQFLHKDEVFFPVDAGMETMINAIWAVSDVTKENGGTRVIPGSHKWPEGQQPQIGQTHSIEMKAGSVLLYYGSLYHGGGANIAQEGRKCAVISYSLGWLKQAENFYLSEPWERAKDYPEQLQRLLGYQIHRPNLGYVECVDPIEWLDAGQPPLTAAKDALTPDQNNLVEDYLANPDKYAAYIN